MNSTSPCRQLALAASLLLAPLGAQTAAPSANRFVPENSAVVLRIASPAKWGAQLAHTQAAKLLQSNTLAPLLQQFETGWQRALGEARDNGKFDADLLESLANDWQGEIVVSLQMDFAAMFEASQNHEPMSFSGAIALTAGGDFDMAKFAAELLRACEDRDDMHDLAVGEHRFRVGSLPSDMKIAFGPVIDGALVFLLGADLEQQAEVLLAKDHRYTNDLGHGPLFAHVELQSMMTAIADVIDMRAPPEAAAMVEEVFAAMGLDSLRAFTVAIDVDDESLLGEIGVTLGGKNLGMFGILTGGSSTPALLRAVPPGAEAFSVMPLQLGKLYDLVERVWTAAGDEVPMSFEDAMQGFTEATKVRLKEDLLDHLGDSLLNVQDVEALKSIDADDEDDPMAMLDGTVYGIALKDGAAFGESLETAMRARGMHAAPKTEEYGTAKVHRIKLGGLIDLEYVVTDDLLLLGAGEISGRVLRSVLDARGAGEAADLPEAARAHAAALPAGWNGIGITPLGALLQLFGNALAAAAEGDPELEMAQMVCSGLAEDLKRLGIASLTSAMYFDAKGLRTRFRW